MRPELPFLISSLSLPSPSPSRAFTPIVLSRFLRLQLVSSNPREGPPWGQGAQDTPSPPSWLTREKTGKARCFTDVADFKQNNSTEAPSLRPQGLSLEGLGAMRERQG